MDEVSTASPLGTILAWVPKPEASQTAETLPEGWLPCDGSTITKGPWTGGKTPDLNSIGAFLRGGSDDKVLEVEDDQVQDHEHEDSGHQHDCSAWSSGDGHQHAYHYSRANGKLLHGSTICGCDNWDCPDPDGTSYDIGYTDSTAVSVTTLCSTSAHSSGIGGVGTAARSGTETRPINMKVSYVMRCW